MGASWDDVLQVLLLDLAIQMIASVVCVMCACLWGSFKERMARPAAGGKPMAEPDLEMGTVAGGEGCPGAYGSVAESDDALHGGNLERSEDITGLQSGAVALGERSACKQIADFLGSNDYLVRRCATPIMPETHPPTRKE